jgi:hypothetical protein
MMAPVSKRVMPVFGSWMAIGERLFNPFLLSVTRE